MGEGGSLGRADYEAGAVQEAYFAIGKLLATQAQGVASERKLAGLIAEVGKH